MRQSDQDVYQEQRKDGNEEGDFDGEKDNYEDDGKRRGGSDEALEGLRLQICFIIGLHSRWTLRDDNSIKPMRRNSIGESYRYCRTFTTDRVETTRTSGVRL
jgi:hypothetical protein